VANIRVRRSGRTYQGGSPEGIVRRVWGKSAQLAGFTQISARSLDTSFLAEVTRRDQNGTRVVDHVVVRP